MGSRAAEQRRGSLPVAGDLPGTGPGRHGLTRAEIGAIVAAQRGACGVCGRPLPPVPHIDHDHAAAARHPHPVSRGCRDCVRGALCRDCNLVLGHARDDAAVLRAAVRWLEERRVR